MRKRSLLIAGGLVVLTVGCGDGATMAPSSTPPSSADTHGTSEASTTTTTAAADDPFTDTAWDLESLVSSDGSEVSPVDDAHLSFSEDQVEARATCNEMTGVYEVVGDTLDIQVQSLTDVACSGEAGEQETHIFAVLEGEPTWEVSDDVLTLAIPDGRGLQYRAAQSRDPDDDVTQARIEGETRFHTAANIAKTAFSDASVAILASARQYPDAVAASYLAGVEQGPVLLTERDWIPDSTMNALATLGVQTTVLVGGPLAISEDVETQLAAQGHQVIRHHGPDRYETAAALAVAYGDDGPVGTVDGDRTALLATGVNFPDALSVGPLAAGAHLPLLLTPADGPHDAVTRTLQELDIERLMVVGGPDAISAAVLDFYAQQGYHVERLAGGTRAETSVVVARHAIARLPGFSASNLLLARGDDFPDALTAASLGAMLDAPILLTESPSVLSGATRGYLTELCPQVSIVHGLGGSSAIHDHVLAEAVGAAEECDSP